MPIRNNLSTILGRRRMKQSELARQSGLSYQTVTDFYHARGKGLTYSTLEAICRALECQPGDLLEYVEEKEDERE